MLGFISKMFGGSKSEKDIKSIQPIVAVINQHLQSFQSLSNDELRGKTEVFRQKIREHLNEIDTRISTLSREAEELPFSDISGKDNLYNEIDKLRKDRDKEIEVVLNTIVPEAFAVVKETARRFMANTEITASATQLDRDLSIRKEYIRIEGDKSIFSNSWKAGGNVVTWNMVHYDVQLIGGMVLHQGKIAEMATGEGKTLVSTLPAYLNALTGEGVHIVTVNDYLAKRDSEWNGPLYEWLGLTVDCIDRHAPNSHERKKAYRADIT